MLGPWLVWSKVNGGCLVHLQSYPSMLSVHLFGKRKKKKWVGIGVLLVGRFGYIWEVIHAKLSNRDYHGLALFH